jgi:hypothetical protein
VAFCSQITLDSVSLIQELPKWKNLTSLDLSLRTGQHVDLSSLCPNMPRLRHLRVLGQDEGALPCDIRILPNGLETLHVFLSDLSAWDLSLLPPDIVDLKLLCSSPSFDASSIVKWPSTITKLEFSSDSLSDNHLLQLRARLPLASHVRVWGNVHITGAVWSNGTLTETQKSQISELDSLTLPKLLNQLLSPIKASNYFINAETVLPESLKAFTLIDHRLLQSRFPLSGVLQRPERFKEYPPELLISLGQVSQKFFPLDLTSLCLRFSYHKSVYSSLPKRLVHLHLDHVQSFTNAPISPLSGFLENLPSTLKTFNCPNTLFRIEDIGHLPRSITTICIGGGKKWTEQNLEEILVRCPDLQSLKVTQTCLTGHFLTADTTEVTRDSLLKSAFQGLLSLVKPSNKMDFKLDIGWMYDAPLKLPDTVTVLHLIPPVRRRFLALDGAMIWKNESFSLKSLPPMLRELSFAQDLRIQLPHIGPSLPPTLEKLCIVSTQGYSSSQSGNPWPFFPQSLKSIQLFCNFAHSRHAGYVERATQLPPSLEELVMPHTQLYRPTNPAALKFLHSLKVVDFADPQDHPATLPWMFYDCI